MENDSLVLGFLAAGVCLLALMVVSISPSFAFLSALGGGSYYSAQIYESLDGRIIYMSDVPLNSEPFIADCQRRNGVFGEEFNGCGTMCIPLPDGEEECVDACVYSCEFNNKD